MLQKRRHFLHFAAVLAPCLLLVACDTTSAPPAEAANYRLRLVPGPPLITRVLTTNAAGQTLSDGRPDIDGKFTADPELGALDGSLEITVTWSDGMSSTYQVSHPPGQPVNLTYNKTLHRFEPSN